MGAGFHRQASPSDHPSPFEMAALMLCRSHLVEGGMSLLGKMRRFSSYPIVCITGWIRGQSRRRTTPMRPARAHPKPFCAFPFKFLQLEDIPPCFNYAVRTPPTTFSLYSKTLSSGFPPASLPPDFRSVRQNTFVRLLTSSTSHRNGYQLDSVRLYWLRPLAIRTRGSAAD